MSGLGLKKREHVSLGDARLVTEMNLGLANSEMGDHNKDKEGNIQMAS